METVLKADIFFFITTVAIAALSIVLLAILINIYRIVRNVRRTSDALREKGEFLTNIATLDVLRIRKFAWGFVEKFLKKRKKRKRHDKDADEEANTE